MSTPLCVDLDGSLCRSDTLFEAFLSLLKREPWALLLAPFWLFGGRAAFKRRIAGRAALNVAALPWRQELVEWLKGEKASGRQLLLCTGADERIARDCAAHLGLFDEVLASDGRTNLTGRHKRAALIARFGDRGFDYLGNERADLKVWSAAREALIAGGSPRLRAQAGAVAKLGPAFPDRPVRLTEWLKALRPHQWIKNVLVLVPAVLGQRLDAATLWPLLIAFVAFSLCASSVYLINDLLDLEADRQHPRKCQRPFAAARLPLLGGLALAPLLLLAAFALAALLAPRFLLVLAGYYLLTLAYSLHLKRVPIVDVLMLAALYTLRLIAGGEAAGVQLTFWLLAFSTFLFLSLAIVKRYAEMDMVKASAGEKAAGRGYHVDDLPLLRNLGTSAGYGAVVVLALYINSPESEHLYHHPRRLWLLAPLVLYWISRIWLKTHRGLMHDDPIVFALKDRVSRFVLLACLAAGASATL